MLSSSLPNRIQHLPLLKRNCYDSSFSSSHPNRISYLPLLEWILYNQHDFSKPPQLESPVATGGIETLQQHEFSNPPQLESPIATGGIGILQYNTARLLEAHSTRRTPRLWSCDGPCKLVYSLNESGQNSCNTHLNAHVVRFGHGGLLLALPYSLHENGRASLRLRYTS